MFVIEAGNNLPVYINNGTGRLWIPLFSPELRAAGGGQVWERLWDPGRCTPLLAGLGSLPAERGRGAEGPELYLGEGGDHQHIREHFPSLRRKLPAVHSGTPG